MNHIIGQCTNLGRQINPWSKDLQLTFARCPMPSHFNGAVKSKSLSISATKGKNAKKEKIFEFYLLQSCQYASKVHIFRQRVKERSPSDQCLKRKDGASEAWNSQTWQNMCYTRAHDMYCEIHSLSSVWAILRGEGQGKPKLRNVLCQHLRDRSAPNIKGVIAGHKLLWKCFKGMTKAERGNDHLCTGWCHLKL